MAELYDERRQERRFALPGVFRLGPEGSEPEGHIYDLSLNGVMLERLPDQELAKGDKFNLTLCFPGEPPFLAEVMIVYAGTERLGVEFYDMDPGNFSVLAGLIHKLYHNAFEKIA